MQEEKDSGEDINWDVDEDSCLFISKHKLFRVRCPFPVFCNVKTPDFDIDEEVRVTQVTNSHEKVILYRVCGKLYPHFYFSYHPPTQYVLTRIESS
jgi:hypothetical protein